MVSPAIEVTGMRKRYGAVAALAGVDLHVEAGIVYGLLGPNGAGKTTLVRILTTLLLPDEGGARVAGIDVLRDPDRLRQRVGLAGQYAAVDENLTGFENLYMVGRLYHLDRSSARRRADELLEVFDLADAGGRLVRTYSGGMRRRLDLAGALVARPPVVFLDEPTTGLDPRSRIALWDTIENLVAAGTTVLLTTQYLDEADRLANRLAVIDHGRMIAEGTSADLKAQTGGDRLELRLSDRAQGEAALAALAPLAAGSPSLADSTVCVPLQERRGALAEAIRRLDRVGVDVDDLAVRSPTLDEVFLQLTGHAAEPDEGATP
ncbi:MAG TPA: ATP-binding cassette domain-containing protein [Gaiellales bacterium]|jgi:ABC-2 type transport system ATP-binding protein|nr:ATP-binding cassette domain-containing protein [Gaiellales bacterium]